MRAWIEIVNDILALVWTALSSPKGIELLDELAQVLGIPDPFPNVDGLQSDDVPRPTPTATPRRAAPVADIPAQPLTADAPETLSPDEMRAALTDALKKKGG